MKVLQINSVCGIRSTGRICTDIAEVLEREGHECKIAFGRLECPERYQRFALPFGGTSNVLPHMLGAVVLDNAGFSSKRATKELIQKIREFSPDVIHLHNIHGFYINVEILFDFLKKADIPVVWTLHDCWSFTGHCAYFDYVKCEKWKAGCHHCPQKREYPQSYLLDRSKRNYERKKAAFTSLARLTVITPSQWLADLVAQSYLKGADCRVIHNGIDLSVFHPVDVDVRAKYNISKDKKIVLGVASIWEARKGLPDFLKLAEQLDNDYQIVLVGLSQKQIQDLPSKVIGISRTNNTEELAALYTAATVLVNPTYDDNYPTVNLEAQACGTPVITYQTGGSVESVPSNHVIPLGDIDGLKHAILHLHDTKEAYLERAQHFDKTEKYYEYLRLYEELANS